MKSLGVERMGRCTLEEWMVTMGLGTLTVVLELLMQPKARWGLMLRERRRRIFLHRFIHILISFTVHYCSYVNKDYLKDGELSPFPVSSLKRDLRKPVFLLPSDKEN